MLERHSLQKPSAEWAHGCDGIGTALGVLDGTPLTTSEVGTHLCVLKADLPGGMPGDVRGRPRIARQEDEKRPAHRLEAF